VVAVASVYYQAVTLVEWIDVQRLCWRITSTDHEMIFESFEDLWMALSAGGFGHQPTILRPHLLKSRRL
jgi:hypothetical protein